MSKSYLEIIAINRILSLPLPAPIMEYKFHPLRKWKFDFAWPDKMIAIEMEGGIWKSGRHNRGVGFTLDCQKYNAATIAGWRVLRYTISNIDDLIADLKLILDTPSRMVTL